MNRHNSAPNTSETPKLAMVMSAAALVLAACTGSGHGEATNTTPPASTTSKPKPIELSCEKIYVEGNIHAEEWKSNTPRDAKDDEPADTAKDLGVSVEAVLAGEHGPARCTSEATIDNVSERIVRTTIDSAPCEAVALLPVDIMTKHLDPNALRPSQKFNGFFFTCADIAKQ